MKLSDIKAGDVVRIDGGFTCMLTGTKNVCEDSGGLYVTCDEGKHYLEGQEDENGELVGIAALGE